MTNKTAGDTSCCTSHVKPFGFDGDAVCLAPGPADAAIVANSDPGGLSAAGRSSGPAAGTLSAPGLVEPVTPCNRLVAIVGPTAAGKSALALGLAEHLDGEIVNYDSVQLFRGFDVGAGKLPTAERRGVPHHLLDCLEPEQLFTAGDYRREALRVLTDLRARAKLPVFVGGTGLYLRALLLGLFEGPPRSEALRERLRALARRRGSEHLHRLLERLDPAAAERIQARDTQKILRAIEVCLLARKPLSALHARGREGLKGYQIHKIGLNPERGRLYERIDCRVRAMFAGGLMEEVRTLLARPDACRIKPLEALGYRQACAVLRGEISLEEAIRLTQVATRHYAKRQLTWLRPESAVVWFEGFGDDPETLPRVLSALEQMGLPGRSEMPAPRRPASIL